MLVYDLNDIDFEDMDDLPLSDHVEWETIGPETSCRTPDEVIWAVG